MTKKKRIPDKYQIWIDVRKRYHLSHLYIQMARELGMNPRKLGKIANEKQEPWKTPLPAFIERIYPPTQKVTVFETADECVEGTLRSSYERSGVCFGGFRPSKHVEEPRLRAVTPASTKRSGEGRHFGVQAPASARGGSTLSVLVEKAPLMLNP